MRRNVAILLGALLAAAPAFSQSVLDLDGRFSVTFPAEPQKIPQGEDTLYQCATEDSILLASVSPVSTEIASKADLEDLYRTIGAGFAAGMKGEAKSQDTVLEGGLYVGEYAGSSALIPEIHGKLYLVGGTVYGFFKFGATAGADPFADPFFNGLKPSRAFSFDTDQKNASGSAAFRLGERIGTAVGLPALIAVVVGVVLVRRKKKRAAAKAAESKAPTDRP